MDGARGNAGRNSTQALNPMWQFLFRPEVLFGLAAIQGLLPYAVWWSGLDSAPESVNFTYLPVVIWIIAYVAFLLGTATSRRLYADCQYDVAPKKRKVSTFAWITAGLIVVQLAGVTAIYGTLPILSFLSNDGRLNVNDVNNLQETSGLGQIGFIAACNVVFNGAILLRLLCHLDRRERVSAGTIGLLAISMLSALYGGKRQGLLITAVYLTCGLSLYARSPVVALAVMSKLPLKAKNLALVFIAFAVFGFVSLVGYLSTARNQGARGRSGVEETLAYLEYPLLNLERQTQSTGLGPYKYDLLYPILPLIPFKMQQALADRLIPPPVKPVVTSPSGFFERLQWGWGPIGIALFCFVAGAYSMRLYHRSKVSVMALLIYCQCAYVLLSAYAYNHFVNLVFFPLPALIFFWIGERFRSRLQFQPSTSPATTGSFSRRRNESASIHS